MDTSSNPLALPPSGDGGGDVEAGPPPTRQQHMGLQARVETLEQGGGAVDAAIRSVFASIGTAPTNWHQATIFFLSAEKEVDQTMRKRAPLMFAGGLLIILLQILVIAGVWLGSLAPSCQSNAQCVAHGHPGTVCMLGRCFFCGQRGIYPQNDTVACHWGLNEPHVGRSPETWRWGQCYPNVYKNKTVVAEVCADPQDRLAWRSEVGELNDPAGFKAENVRAWCEACVFTDGEVNRYTLMDNTVGNIMSMGAYDWATLFFATYVVGLSIVGELRDIELCSLAIERIPAGALGKKWILAVSFCLELRRFVFLPAMLTLVSTLVMTRGGDALSVCFNTVAIIFLVDIDNMSYHIGLGEFAKARVESAGRVVLSGAEAKELAWLKVMYVPITFVSVLSSVATMDIFLGMGFTFFMYGFVAPAAPTIARYQLRREDQPPAMQLWLRLAVLGCKFFFGFALMFVTAAFGKFINV
eukprot:SAG22_NODE_1698_length_3788_cov_3.925725_2_plen_469_part_00